VLPGLSFQAPPARAGMLMQWVIKSMRANSPKDRPESLGLNQVHPKFACFTGTKVQILTLTRLPGYC
jgi:hypothetical protein